MLAMDVNDNAYFLNERVALGIFASKLAPTGVNPVSDEIPIKSAGYDLPSSYASAGFYNSRSFGNQRRQATIGVSLKRPADGSTVCALEGHLWCTRVQGKCPKTVRRRG